MSDLIEIQSQIEKLQKQAGEIKAREFGKTVQDILVKMQAFGITLKDLQPGKARGAKGKAKPTKVVKAGATAKLAGAGDPKKVAAPVPAKYCGPNGETWSGRGLTPRWLTALLVDGKSKEDFAIKS
ncbi:MAG: H-NS histone family protein [Rhodoferax sp.]|uniref:H-NS histone family protein n=1 Tax=Rhodoferax sp. TaxID=50421 RepID=UPI0013FFC34E|nr:H-NS histone family protein [Rhodoferax sp.]NDP39891.1 H-NS histone family protein [Rhodoferax sp.]